MSRQMHSRVQRNARKKARKLWLSRNTDAITPAVLRAWTVGFNTGWNAAKKRYRFAPAQTSDLAPNIAESGGHW